MELSSKVLVRSSELTPGDLPARTLALAFPSTELFSVNDYSLIRNSSFVLKQSVIRTYILSRQHPLSGSNRAGILAYAREQGGKGTAGHVRACLLHGAQRLSQVRQGGRRVKKKKNRSATPERTTQDFIETEKE